MFCEVKYEICTDEPLHYWFQNVFHSGHIFGGHSFHDDWLIILWDKKLLTRLLSLQLTLFDLCRVSCLYLSRSVSLYANQMRGYFRLSPSQVSHPPPSLSISHSSPSSNTSPPSARPTAHQNDNSIDVKCVAFGPLKHITPACLAQPPPQFMALLCPLLCPPLLGWADNNLENSLYMSLWVRQRLSVCWRVCPHMCVCALYIRIN